jgi:hypothetical protein
MGYHPATKKICALITSMLCLPIFISANVYEGSIDKYSIWITFDSQTPDGIINGTYFYCSTGRDIQLEGTKNGSVISFTESDKNGNVTGKFSLTIKGIELSGTWINGNGKKKFAVKACESTLEKMKDAQHEAQLDIQDKEMLNKEYPKEDDMTRSVIYEYKSKYIRSVRFFAEYTGGPYPSSQSIIKVYNSLTGQTINFWDEIEPAIIAEVKAYLQVETQKKFIEWRAGYPDSEWVNIFKTESLDKIFTIKNADTIMTEFIIDSEGVKLGRCFLFDFPHVIQAMDFCDYVLFSPEYLKKILKSNSILLTLVKQ